MRRSTVVRLGVALLVLAALGIGTAIGLAVGSRSTQTETDRSRDYDKQRAESSTTTSLNTSTTSASSVPAVLSCGPGPTPHVRPTILTIGCATRAVTVTDITWNAWGTDTGGQGTGTVNQGFQSAPAIVVVFHAVNGIFQDISVTPIEGRFLDSSDRGRSRPDGQDDHFDRSSENDDDHWWHPTSGSITAWFRVGRKLKASSVHHSRRRQFQSDPRRVWKSLRSPRWKFRGRRPPRSLVETPGREGPQQRHHVLSRIGKQR